MKKKQTKMACGHFDGLMCVWTVWAVCWVGHGEIWSWIGYVDCVCEQEADKIGHVDCVMLDHAKDLYLPDLLFMEVSSVWWRFPLCCALFLFPVWCWITPRTSMFPTWMLDTPRTSMSPNRMLDHLKDRNVTPRTSVSPTPRHRDNTSGVEGASSLLCPLSYGILRVLSHIQQGVTYAAPPMQIKSYLAPPLQDVVPHSFKFSNTVPSYKLVVQFVGMYWS